MALVTGSEKFDYYDVAFEHNHWKSYMDLIIIYAH